MQVAAPQEDGAVVKQVEAVKFCLGKDGSVRIGDGDLVSAVDARVQLGAGSWVELDGDAREEKDGSIVWSSTRNPLEVVAQTDGTIRVGLGTDSTDADTTRVSQVQLVLRNVTNKYTTEYTQGYQTWNLNSSHRIGTDRRHKSIASKVGLSGMFLDTDGPAWTQFKGNGLESHGVLVLCDSEHRDFLALGGTSCLNATTSFWTQSGRRGGKRQTDIFCVFAFGLPGVLVGGKADASTCKEMFSMNQSGSATALLEQYADECRSNQDDNSGDDSLAMNSPLRDLGHAPVGWGSWYEFYEHVKADDVNNVLGALSKDTELKKTIDVFQLDDGYQSQTGDWLTTQKKFGEEDLSNVAMRIESEGFAPGLWVAPFLASKHSKVFKEHPDWFIRCVDKPNKYVVGHINPAWRRGLNINSWIMHVLDLSKPEVLKHIEETFRALAEQGWQFFKIDFLAAGMREGIRANGDSVTRVQAYIEGCKAVRRGIGSSNFLLGCGAPLMASAQSNCFDSMRVSCDTAERWLPPWIAKQVIGDWATPCCGNALWGNMTRWFMHEKLWKFNDPDCLVLRRKGNSMTEAQIKTQVTILGLTGGLLLFTDNMATLEQDRKELAYGVLPTTRLCGRPIKGLTQANHAPTAFELNDHGDDSLHAVVALLNWEKNPAPVIAPRDGFDFWGKRRVRAGEQVQLDAYGVCALQCEQRGAFLIGTTLHMSALADERITQKISADGTTCTIEGTDEFVLKNGSLIFDGNVVNVKSSDGVKILGKGTEAVPGGAGAILIEIVSKKWSLEVDVQFAKQP